MKKLMVLGAGIYQLPLIRKAREMGLYTIVISIPGPYPGFAEADESIYLNTVDTEELLLEAKKRKIDAICTTGTDVAIPSLARICNKLKLPGLSLQAARMLTDKCLMKEMFRRGGVKTADYYVVESEEAAQRAADNLGYPVIVKASDSSGSRGITIVRHPALLAEAILLAKRVSRNGRLIVERFLDGHEIGVDGFVLGGKLVLCLPHNKFVYHTARTGIPAGHSFPFVGDEILQQKIRHQFRLVIAASGADNCAINADIMVCNGEPYVLEMGARAGATGIPEIISLYSGVDYYRLIIEAAMGIAHPPRAVCNTPAMSRLIFAEKNGCIRSINETLLSQAREGTYALSLDCHPGDYVFVPRNGSDRIGQLILATDREEVALGKLALVHRAIEIASA